MNISILSPLRLLAKTLDVNTRFAFCAERAFFVVEVKSMGFVAQGHRDIVTVFTAHCIS